MPEIFIKCPETQEILRTGFAADNLESTVFSNKSVNCQHCGKIHIWSNKDAFFI